MIKIIKKYIYVIVLVLLPLTTHSQIENPLKNIDDIKEFVQALLDYIIKMGSVVAVFFFIYVGYLFVKAKGNQSQLTTAKTALINTVIGVALLLGATLISEIILDTIKNIE